MMLPQIAATSLYLLLVLMAILYIYSTVDSVTVLLSLISAARVSFA